MKLIVSGCGSGGTNLGIELIRSFDSFSLRGSATSSEDRKFFNRLYKNKLPERCATKLATENKIITTETLLKVFREYDNFRMVFMFRNPVDTCLSKISRGNKDNLESIKSAMKIPEYGLRCEPNHDDEIKDSIISGAITSVKNMYDIYFSCKKQYSDKIYEIKMEDLIVDRNKIRKELSEWLGIEYDGKSPEFWLTTKKLAHVERYKGELAMNINLYKDLKNSYGGRFIDFKSEVEKIASCFKKEMELMKYEY